MTIKKNLLLATLGLVMAVGAATAASASDAWQANHPRRAEVNARLHNQAQRIRDERREGEISARQAYRLHLADRRIRHQERAYARFHGGHISRDEQIRLNREENAVGRHIPG